MYDINTTFMTYLVHLQWNMGPFPVYILNLWNRWQVLWCKIYIFFSPLTPSKREKNVLVLFKNIIVNFIIQKLKRNKLSSKNTFFAHFEGTRGEKPQIFRTWISINQTMFNMLGIVIWRNWKVADRTCQIKHVFVFQCCRVVPNC